MAVYKPSLSDAKILKNITQNLIGSDFTGDFAEVVEAFPDILGNEFAA